MCFYEVDIGPSRASTLAPLSQLSSSTNLNDTASVGSMFPVNCFDNCSVIVLPLIMTPPCESSTSTQLSQSKVTVCVCHALGFWFESSKSGCIAATIASFPSNHAKPNPSTEFMKSSGFFFQYTIHDFIQLNYSYL